MLRDVHADILKIRRQHRWLDGYSEANVHLRSETSRIEFYPKHWDAGGDGQPQQPDHLFVRFNRLGTRGLKYNNALEHVETCVFAGLGVSVYGDVTARGSNSYLKERLTALIEHRCEQVQRTLKRNAR